MTFNALNRRIAMSLTHIVTVTVEIVSVNIKGESTRVIRKIPMVKYVYGHNAKKAAERLCSTLDAIRNQLKP